VIEDEGEDLRGAVGCGLTDEEAYFLNVRITPAVGPDLKNGSDPPAREMRYGSDAGPWTRHALRAREAKVTGTVGPSAMAADHGSGATLRGAVVQGSGRRAAARERRVRPAFWPVGSTAIPERRDALRDARTAVGREAEGVMFVRAQELDTDRPARAVAQLDLPRGGR